MAKRKKPKVSKKPPPTIGVVIGSFSVGIVLVILGSVILYFNRIEYDPFFQLASSFVIPAYMFGGAAMILGIWKSIDLWLYRRAGRKLAEQRKWQAPKNKKKK